MGYPLTGRTGLSLNPAIFSSATAVSYTGSVVSLERGSVLPEDVYSQFRALPTFVPNSESERMN